MARMDYAAKRWDMLLRLSRINPRATALLSSADHRLRGTQLFVVTAVSDI